MKPPIIIDEHGDIEIYSSVKIAEADVEPIDVRNDEYVFYDCEGMILQPSIVEVPGKVFLLETAVEHVRLLPSEVYRRDDLIRALIAYLQKLGHDRMILKTMELEELMSLITPR